MHPRRLLPLVLSLLSLAPVWGQNTLDEALPATLRPDSLPASAPAAAPPAASDAERLQQVPAAATLAPTMSSGTASLRIQLDSLLAAPLFQTSQVAVYVYDLTTDSPLYARGERQRLRPASCQKVLTAVAALSQIEARPAYATTAYAEGRISGGTLRGNLVLRAAFDPQLSSAELRQLAASVAAAGVHRVEGQLVFDISMKDTLSRGWGWCWDDRTPPLAPLLCDGREGLELKWRAELAAAGVDVPTEWHYAETSADARPLASIGRTIDQVLLPMMKESDNLSAESLFFRLAAESGRPYATRREGAAAVQRLLAQAGADPDASLVADGSGLSLYNYTTAETLGLVLRYAYRHSDLFLHLRPALPIAGQDGTLERRMTEAPAAGNVRAKTGTVEGVSSLAGYCIAANGHELCFAIINQGVRRGADARRFQDAVCRALVAAQP